MKRLTLLVITLIGLVNISTAQTLAQDSHSKLYGYKNALGAWQIAPQYQYAYAFEGKAKKFAVVKVDRRWGCIDNCGHLVVRPIFPTMEEAEGAGLEWEKSDEPGRWVYPAQNPADGRWGFVNYYGNWKFDPVYEGVGRFIGEEPMSFAAVKSGGRWGCIDRKGILIIDTIFLEQAHAELAGRQWIFGQNYETWRYPTTDPKHPRRWGYVNYLGRWVISPEYRRVDFFGDDHNYNYAHVQRWGRWGTIDRWGNIFSNIVFPTEEEAHDALRQYEHGRPIDDWRIPITKPNTSDVTTDTTAELWGYVDYKGEWVIAPIYQGASHFVNDTGLFATVKLNGYWASISADGTLLSRNVFTLSSEAAQAGYEWDNDQGKNHNKEHELGHWLYPIQNPSTKAWGYVNYKGEWVLQPNFEDAKLFIYAWNNRAAPAKMDGRWGVIDHTGQFVVKNIYETSSEAYIKARQWSERNKF